MPSVVFLAFLVVPLVCHYFTFDVARGSSASALIVGVAAGAAAGWAHGIGLFFLAFFFVAALGFIYASVIGSAYCKFGSQERREAAERALAKPPSEVRVAIGGVGAILIGLAFFASELAAYVGTGKWDAVPLKAILGFIAFFVLGIIAIAPVVRAKKGKNGSDT